MAKGVHTAGIKDTATQRAVRVLEADIASLRTSPSVTGSTAGNAALESLIAALAQLGLITDETT